MMEKTKAYLTMVVYCCLKKPSDPSRIVDAMEFILGFPVFSCMIQVKIYHMVS